MITFGSVNLIRGDNTISFLEIISANQLRILFTLLALTIYMILLNFMWCQLMYSTLKSYNKVIAF